MQLIVKRLKLSLCVLNYSEFLKKNFHAFLKFADEMSLLFRMSPLPWNLTFGLDSEADGSIAINLLPLVSPSRQLASGKAGAEKQNTTTRFDWIHFRLQ